MEHISDYGNQLVAYIDLLGFSEAISNQEDKSTIFNLLKSRASSRGDFAIETLSKDAESTTIKTTPCVSTFSDNMIISYKLKDGEKFMTICYLMNLKRIFFKIAKQALPIGFMIRGGITIGPLYHSQSEGIVFGEALVEAHKLESSVAIYPRIVLSRNVAALIPTDFKKEDGTTMQDVLRLMVLDFDGIHFLDYFSLEILEQFFPTPAPTNWEQNLLNWISNVNEVIKANIVRHTHDEDLSKLAKWSWFSRYFNEVLGYENKFAALGCTSINEIIKRISNPQ